MMKSLILATLVAAFTVGASQAQDDKTKRKSPPATAKETVGDVTVTIAYSQPSVKDRTVWGDLVPYGKVWRTGANEATTIEFSKDVTINGKKLKAGKYALFTIPNEGQWTVIFNSEAEQWGAYKYKEAQDALRVDVKPSEAKHMEKMTFTVSKDGEVSLHWEKLKVSFSVAGA